MSTSRSDTGVGALFQRAVEERREEAASSAAAAPHDARLEARSCTRCGAAREREELVCRYCGEAL
jgi:hypothetical protein